MLSARTLPACSMVATLGAEPQVVTAALDLLLEQGENIHQVIVVHTEAPGTPIAQAREKLSDIFDDSVYQGKIRLEWQPIQDPQGNTLQDVETPDSIQAAFRSLYRQVRRVKRSGDRVHLSIAGGRKTMAVFGMLTAQLLFDASDRLWHLYSGGDFLSGKRFHPQPGDDVHLIPIPVIQWSKVSPILLDIARFEDPYEALQRYQELRIAERLEDARGFINGSLTPAEERVVALLVREGLSDNEIAERLTLSPRTVEEHLRSAYAKASNHWELPNVNRSQLITLLNLFYLAADR